MDGLELDPATWKILNRLLGEALDLPPEQRDTWLRTLPAAHQHLRPRLTSLLSHSTDDRFETLPKIEAERSRSTHLEGSEVGPYRLLRLLAEGGMGAVWLAERIDGRFDRTLALKLPLWSAARPELAKRLERECRILALLDHPNVARLYDAGVTAQRQPFLALEFVDGQSIDRFAAERGLDTDGRLRLFVQLLDAVAYAHRRLVIHRDLKPSNVLVKNDGQVKLLDFGIARLLDQGTVDESVLTRETGIALTIAYASPEQIRAETLTVASDIYSLGVVLYELLTGVRPARPNRDSAGAIEEAILHDEPAKPSEAAEPALRRRLRGDLDTILLKAIKKNPEERYATVDAFRTDVEAYLDGAPVQARPDRTFYRLRKLVVRHRWAVGAASAIILAILTGAGAAVWQARIAIAQRQRAEEVKRFIVSIFKEANVDTGTGQRFTVVDLLSQARDRVVKAPLPPEIKVELFQLVGDGLMSMHDAAAAESVFEEAIEAANAHFGPDDIRTIRARLSMGESRNIGGKIESLTRLLDELVPQLERHPDASAADVVRAYRLRGYVSYKSGDYEATVAILDKALLHSLEPEEKQRFLVLVQLAEALTFLDRHDEALGAIRKAEALIDDMYDGNAKHPSVMYMRGVRSVVQGRSGDLNAAISGLQDVVRDRIELFGKDAYAVAITLNNLVPYQLQAGHIADAVDGAARAVELFTQHAEARSMALLAAKYGYATALLEARRGSKARGLLVEARRQLSAIFGAQHLNTVSARAKHALAMGFAAHLETGIDEIRELEGELGPSSKQFWPKYAAGMLHRLAGRPAPAARYLGEALALAQVSKVHGREAQTQLDLGVVLVDLDQRVRGVLMLKKGLAQLDTDETVRSLRVADALIALGEAALAEDRAVDARRMLTRACTFWDGFAPKSAWAARCHQTLDAAKDATESRVVPDRNQ